MPKSKPNNNRKRIALYVLYSVCFVLFLVVEGLVTSAIFYNISYRETLNLWDCGGSVEANRRAPDPTYTPPPEPEEVTDSIFDEMTSDSLSTDTTMTEEEYTE